MCWSFCSAISSFGTIFADTLFMAKSSVTMECAEKVLKPTSSAISQIVKRRSRITTAFALAMTWSFRHVDGRPERGSLSTDVRPSLNRLYHSLICVMPIASSPKTV
jgi:hypothetical protein